MKRDGKEKKFVGQDVLGTNKKKRGIRGVRLSRWKRRGVNIWERWT